MDETGYSEGVISLFLWPVASSITEYQRAGICDSLWLHVHAAHPHSEWELAAPEFQTPEEPLPGLRKLL